MGERGKGKRKVREKERKREIEKEEIVKEKGLDCEEKVAERYEV